MRWWDIHLTWLVRSGLSPPPNPSTLGFLTRKSRYHVSDTKTNMPTEHDEHGEYETDAGSPHPVEAEDVGYEPCNAVLKYTFERYGERRYCTAMAEENFKEDGSQFCKHHKSREALMKQQAEAFKHGAYAKSHKHKFQHLPPHKQIMANELYKDLMSESRYEFESDEVEINIDVSDADFAPDADTLVMSHPLPTEHEMRGKALWFAALDFVTMESIREEQFRVAAEETGPDGEPLAVGERTTVVTVTEQGREITDKDEHHLNLPLSRLQKDYERHLKFGGVDTDPEGESAVSIDSRDWVVELSEIDEPAPEADKSDGTKTASDITPDEGDLV